MSRLLISAVSNKDSQMSNKNLQKSKLISVSNKDLQMLRLLVFVSSKDLQMSNLWQVDFKSNSRATNVHYTTSKKNS